MIHKYQKYKNSGIEWLGEIPEHWEVKRVKEIFNLVRGKFTHRPRNDQKMYNNGTFPFLQTGDVAKSSKYVLQYKQVLNENGIKVSRQFKKGTLVMTIAANIGDVALLGFDAYFPDSLVAFKTKHNINFYYYLLSATKSELDTVKITNTQDNLNLERLNSLLKVCPPLPEQTIIANYLDKKTTAIDQKINLLTKKADKYKELIKSLINQTVTKGLDKTVKLKDSGIEWIGEIPVHWEVKRFKDICYKNHTGGTPSTSKEESFLGNNTWVTIRDIGKSKYINKSRLKLTDNAIVEANIPITPKGSLLYSFKLTLGKIGFAEEDIYTNEALITILKTKHNNLDFLYYMLPIFLLINATENIYGAKMLNQKLILNAILVSPPLKEQTAIANYLDTKTGKIDAIVSNIENQINTLKELRKTLINDVVTGKIKVAN